MRFKARFQDRRPPRLYYADALQNGCGFIPKRNRVKPWEVFAGIIGWAVVITALFIICVTLAKYWFANPH